MIVGAMLARNEGWVIGFSLRVALLWCDKVVVFDHASTDDTGDIVGKIGLECPGRVVVIGSDDPKWLEMGFRQEMLSKAIAEGATHLALIDADEALTANMLPSIRGLVECLPSGYVLSVPMICPWRGMTFHRVDDASVWGRAVISVAVALSGGLAWRPTVAGYQHHHREPYGVSGDRRTTRSKDGGGVMHLQWVNWMRLLWKQRLYVVKDWLNRQPTETAKAINNRYCRSVDEGGLLAALMPKEWTDGYSDLLQHLHFDGCPVGGWHEREVRRLVSAAKPGSLDGLNLFGWDLGAAVVSPPGV